jgi:hypothetical protein
MSYSFPESHRRQASFLNKTEITSAKMEMISTASNARAYKIQSFVAFMDGRPVRSHSSAASPVIVAYREIAFSIGNSYTMSSGITI